MTGPLNITSIRVRVLSPPEGSLKAVCSVTIDEAFVIRDLKVVANDKGTFIAMPSRRVSDRCPQCAAKNSISARYCNDCGTRLPQRRPTLDRSGRPRLYVDLVHPISSECRVHLQAAILQAYTAECASMGEQVEAGASGEAPHPQPAPESPPGTPTATSSGAT
ncbi:MAG: septation protein SpoVG family protein [Planctomycetes bacterium]|nr:septation protein SpoVG family protein [Planctomycetota bacterium]